MAGRILIADGVATNRIILKVKLAAASYNIWQADSAKSLIKTAQRIKPDLILMDAQFLNSDGFHCCQILKSSPATSSIPLIMMARDYDRNTRLAALRAGADDVIPKPVDDAILLARIRNMLRARGLEEEHERREITAAEFGFQEQQKAFETLPQVLLISEHSNTSVHLQNALQHKIPANFKSIERTTALDEIGRLKGKPDAIIIHATARSEKQEILTLVAELRSRKETRYSPIIMALHGTFGKTAISALDMGVNDLIEEDSLPEEYELRIATQIARKKKADRLRATFEKGLELATTDPLTGLFNRRYALPHTGRIAEQSRITGKPFAVMVLDLDRFKSINDTFGHSAGDAVLKEIAHRLKDNLRSVDLICRIGGEEFLVVMPDTELHAAQAAAERLRHATQAKPVAISGRARGIPVTLSIGVSIGGLAGQATIPVDQVVDHADRALMGAKSHGRNQVVFDKSAA